jgi:hypothetical protein
MILAGNLQNKNKEKKERKKERKKEKGSFG